MFNFINNLFSYCLTNVSYLSCQTCYAFSSALWISSKASHIHISFSSLLARLGKKMQLSNLYTANEFCPCCILNWGGTCSWSHCFGLISEHFCPLSFDSLYRLFQISKTCCLISLHPGCIHQCFILKIQLDFLGCKAHFIVNAFIVLECQVLLLLLLFYSEVMYIPFYPKALKY